jgi:hypothetical protein
VVSDVEEDDALRIVTDGVRDDPMVWIHEAGVPRLRTLERDDKPVLQTVLEASGLEEGPSTMPTIPGMVFPNG